MQGGRGGVSAWSCRECGKSLWRIQQNNIFKIKTTLSKWAVRVVWFCWKLIWWVLTIYARCEIGFGGGPSAVAAAVTAKIKKIHKKSYDTSILGFSIMLISKMRSVFVLGYPQIPTRAPLGGIRGAKGVKINKPQKIMWYINSRASNDADFKNKWDQFSFWNTLRPGQKGP